MKREEHVSTLDPDTGEHRCRLVIHGDIVSKVVAEEVKMRQECEPQLEDLRREMFESNRTDKHAITEQAYLDGRREVQDKVACLWSTFTACLKHLCNWGRPVVCHLFVATREGETLHDWVRFELDERGQETETKSMNGGLLIRNGECSLHS